MYDLKPRVMWMIHFAYITAVPIYLILAVGVIPPTLRPENQPFAHEPRTTLFFAALCALALIEVVLAMVLPCRLKAQKPNREDSLDTYLAKRNLSMIFMDSFYESIAIYGLVGIIMGLKPWQGYALMGVSLVCLLMAIGRIRSWLEEYKQRSLRF
jgi:hypothetical protein